MHYSEYTLPDGSARAVISTFNPDHGDGEHYIAITVNEPTLNFSEQLHSIERTLHWVGAHYLSNAKIVFKRYFLSDAANQAQYLRQEPDCAISIVEQAPHNSTKIVLWAYAIEGANVQETSAGNIVKAEHGNFTQFFLANYAIESPDLENATIGIFLDYDSLLRQLGCTLVDNCMRTWIYVNDIDANYAAMSKGRNIAFQQLGLARSGHFIASTGIEGRHSNPFVRVHFDAYAIGGLRPEQVNYLKAPDNFNSTTDYGVSFERGTTIDFGDRRHVIISGTASINNRGEVVHVGDVLSQATLMLANVEALLQEAHCGWEDVASAIIYLRNPADFASIAWLISTKIPRVPYVVVHAPVCRPTWLVEIECMAIKAQIDHRFPDF